MINKVEVSHKTIIFTILLLISLWIVVQIRDILLLLFVSFILMSSLSPTVERLEKRHIPRTLSILLIYIILLSILALIGTIIMPPLISQTITLAGGLPDYLKGIVPGFNLQIDTIVQQIVPVGGGVLRISLGIFSNFISLITFLVFTFYFLLERRQLETYLGRIMGQEAGKKVFSVVTDVEVRLGAWVRGELTLMTIIGVFTYIGLTILGIEYALPLAIFAGLLEIVPIIGPIISAVPAVLVALTVSPGLALVVMALYILIQQLENSLVVPTVMRKAVGLSPLVTILALMIGGRLAGVGGALLSIPLVLVVEVILHRVLPK